MLLLQTKCAWNGESQQCAVVCETLDSNNIAERLAYHTFVNSSRIHSVIMYEDCTNGRVTIVMKACI
jgi:hypothetical protein